MNTKNNKLTTGNGQKQAELVMQAGLQLLPLIMNNIPQAVFWKDRDLVYLGCNKAFADDAGFSSPEEIVGKTDFDMPWTDQAELYRADDRLVMESGEPKLNYEEPQTTPNGSTIWLSTSKIPVHENGQVVAVLAMYEDITARKQAEKALQESEQQFRTLYDNATIGLYRTTPDGRILMINPVGLQMLGFDSFEEFSKRNLEESGFEQEDARKKFREKIEREGVIDQESEWIRKDGSIVFVREGATVLRDEHGKVLYYDGSFEDITERKQAEEALHASEERFRRFTEVTVEGLVFHEQGKIIDANPAGLAMFGLSDSEEFIGRNLLEFVVPESHKLVLQQMQLEAVLPYEIQCIRKDGSIFPVETSTRTYKVGDRTIRATSIRDVTETKQAQEALRLSEERFRRFTEATVEGLVFHQQGKIVDVNPAAVAIFGLSQVEDLIGRNLLEFIVPEYHDLVLKKMQSETVLPYEIQGIRKDGSRIPVETSTRAYKVGEQVIRASSIRDITERKQLEAQVQEAFERRGYQVQVSTEISQEVAAASELSDLFDRVVTLTKERLGYYHTQLLRYDASRDVVVLINGYGETGKKMLAGGHQMPMGRGLIGTAAASGETVLRPVLSDDPDWHPNPLLPDTQGEIAVPIKWKDTVLGVLDVQSDRANALSGEDRQLLEGLCGQIAIAIHSAELVETVRQNEARLAEALRTARLANWEYDVEKDIFTFNDQFYSIFHTTAEKAGGYQLSSARYAELFVHPDDMEVVGTEIGKALSSTERVYNTTIDHRIRYEDGGVGYIMVQLTVERDENGKITRYYGANQDITERKQAEAALRESEQLMRTVIDSTPDWIFIKDQDHHYQLTNKGYANALHITPEDFIGKNDLDLGFPEDLVKGNPEKGIRGFWADDLLVMDSNETQVYPDDPATIDGMVHSFHTIKVPLRDADGKAWGVLAFSRDITERKQVEEALRINEARLAEALRTARLANWEYDVEKDIFTFNDQFYSIFHTTVEKAGGYQLSSARYAELFVHPEDMEMVGTEIGKALSSTERVYNATLDHRILYQDGGVGYITVQVTVERDENGKITRYYGANQDITERKKAQEAMAERLEEINRLYQTMSHEGWKTYRATEDLPTGFVFDQTGTKPVADETVLAGEHFASIPMKVLGGEAIGTVDVADDPQNPRSPEDYAFLQQVSDQIALALEGARLAAQTQSALAQSEKLFEASRILTQATDLQELTSSTVTMLGVQEINRAIMATFNYDPEGNIESLDIIANWSNGTGHEVTAIGTHYSLSVIRAMSFFVSPTPVFFNDTFADERVDATTQKLVQNLNLRAVAVLPLHTSTRQIGALILEGENPHEFTNEEIRLFSALAPQISTVLENRRQFERAQQQAERESTLNIISQKIQSATTVEAVLQIAARELGHALGAPMTIAQLSMKDKK